MLRAVVHIMRLPEEVDRRHLYEVLLAREALGSTGIGDGIAIPHVRNPIVLHISRPMIAICFLDHQVDFGALDGQPVGILFTLISPTVRSHLHLLSKLAFALRNPRFKDVITRHGSRQEMYTEACRGRRRPFPGHRAAPVGRSGFRGLRFAPGPAGLAASPTPVGKGSFA